MAETTLSLKRIFPISILLRPIVPTMIKVLTDGCMDEKLTEQEEKALADDGEAWRSEEIHQ